MRDDKFTTGPWNSQFANFGDENEANARLCAVAPELYLLPQMLFDEILRNIWSYQRLMLYMKRILKVQTWAMNGREWERE